MFSRSTQVTRQLAFRRCRALLLLAVFSPAAAAAVPAGVTFLSDFASDPLRGNWAHIQVMHLDRLSASSSETNHGKRAAMVDVRPGDNPMSCCVGSERAEVLHMRSPGGQVFYETVDSGTQYFAVSYKFPADFQSVPPGTPGAWQTILQLHGVDALGAPPAFALDVAGGRFQVKLNTGDLARGSRIVRHELFDSSLNAGNWVDLVIRIKFATDETGSVTVWRRNETEVRFREVLDIQNVPTLQYDSARKIEPGRHYWKQGLYRSAMPFRNVFWMGPMARASTFAAAERAAFNTKSGMPK